MNQRPDITVLFVLCTAFVAAACASAGGGGSACALLDRDSTFAAGGTVYRDCAVDTRARPMNPDLRVDFRQTTPPRSACYSAEVEFVVDTLGRPELPAARVVHATDRGFADAVMALVPTLRYEPARRKGAKVRQIVVEKRSMSTVVVAAPAGSPPPGRGGQRPPNC